MEALFLGCFLGGALFTLANFLLGEFGGHGLDHGHAIPVLSPTSLIAFLTWFGAAGYLATHYLEAPLILALPAACVAGAGAGTAMRYVLGRIRAGERVMDPSDYRLVGTIGRITVPIPEHGVGEVVFTKAGTRRGEAARAKDGQAIGRDVEVVITGYERGIATVEAWEDLIRR